MSPFTRSFSILPIPPWWGYGLIIDDRKESVNRQNRIVGRAALDAVYPLARDHLAFAKQVQAGLAPHKVSDIWLFASSNADTSVDITTGFERKLAARLAHKSQTPNPAALSSGWRERSASIGKSANLALAEAFMLLELD